MHAKESQRLGMRECSLAGSKLPTCQGVLLNRQQATYLPEIAPRQTAACLLRSPLQVATCLLGGSLAGSYPRAKDSLAGIYLPAEDSLAGSYLPPKDSSAGTYLPAEDSPLLGRDLSTC
ncbi:hypothetical protein PCASD_06907 [Puccinia coronata f. sp. avenae]|uniref:Uncharacterized protein n=1 Tax=Puccinia coronata f. sp. avenae TaxID=200324 RepID=A0A2N5V4U2_9BASI|nr:hypothetical protein PCASD_06907 [Puccinia coronata f. sp. avenae]